MPDKQTANKNTEEKIYMSAMDAVLGVRGVNRLSNTLADNISKKISGKDAPYGGIKVSAEPDSLTIEVYITVDYGAKIPQLSWDVQKAVRDSVRKNTGQPVNAVNVHVQGVALPRFRSPQTTGADTGTGR